MILRPKVSFPIRISRSKKVPPVTINLNEYLQVLSSKGVIVFRCKFTGVSFTKRGDSPEIPVDKQTIDSIKSLIGSKFLKLDEWHYYPTGGGRKVEK